MPEYIERQKLIDALPIVNEDKQISLYGAVADFMVIALSIPTADVVEIKHGQWIEKQPRFDVGYNLYACSVCDKSFTFRPVYNYCPHCGADMREGAENDL